MNPSGIVYLTHVANVAKGCEPVSAGCSRCWAATLASRFAGPGERWEGFAEGGEWTGKVAFDPKPLEGVLRRRKPAVVGLSFMGDLFHPAITNDQIAAVFGVVAACPHLTFVLPSKRWGRAREWFAWAARMDRSGEARSWDVCRVKMLMLIGNPPHDDYGPQTRTPWPLPNLYLMCSIEDQRSADERLPDFLACPGKHVVSLEPMIGAVDLRSYMAPPCSEHVHSGAMPSRPDGTCAIVRDEPPWGNRCHGAGLSGVIVGGESGPHARPCDVAWIRDVVRQCKAAGTNVFVKQLGSRSVWRALGDCMVAACNCGGKHESGDLPLSFRDRAGADISEFPDDLKVRELPWTPGGAR